MRTLQTITLACMLLFAANTWAYDADYKEGKKLSLAELNTALGENSNAWSFNVSKNTGGALKFLTDKNNDKNYSQIDYWQLNWDKQQATLFKKINFENHPKSNMQIIRTQTGVWIFSTNILFVSDDGWTSEYEKDESLDTFNAKTLAGDQILVHQHQKDNANVYIIFSIRNKKIEPSAPIGLKPEGSSYASYTFLPKNESELFLVSSNKNRLFSYTIKTKLLTEEFIIPSEKKEIFKDYNLLDIGNQTLLVYSLQQPATASFYYGRSFIGTYNMATYNWASKKWTDLPPLKNVGYLSPLQASKSNHDGLLLYTTKGMGEYFAFALFKNNAAQTGYENDWRIYGFNGIHDTSATIDTFDNELILTAYDYEHGIWSNGKIWQRVKFSKSESEKKITWSRLLQRDDVRIYQQKNHLLIVNSKNEKLGISAELINTDTGALETLVIPKNEYEIFEDDDWQIALPDDNTIIFSKEFNSTVTYNMTYKTWNISHNSTTAEGYNQSVDHYKPSILGATATRIFYLTKSKKVFECERAENKCHYIDMVSSLSDVYGKRLDNGSIELSGSGIAASTISLIDSKCLSAKVSSAKECDDTYVAYKTTKGANRFVRLNASGNHYIKETSAPSPHWKEGVAPTLFAKNGDAVRLVQPEKSDYKLVLNTGFVERCNFEGVCKKINFPEDASDSYELGLQLVNSPLDDNKEIIALTQHSNAHYGEFWFFNEEHNKFVKVLSIENAKKSQLIYSKLYPLSGEFSNFVMLRCFPNPSLFLFKKEIFENNAIHEQKIF